MEEVYQLAQKNNLKVHLDGARLFNAATHLRVDPKEICGLVDSVTFCLSKGLSAILCYTIYYLFYFTTF